MAHSYKFCVVQFPAHPSRDERLNLALAIFAGDFLDIRPAKRLDKLKAISAALDAGAVRESVCQLAELDEIIRSNGPISDTDRLSQLASLVSFSFSPLGQFEAESQQTYEAKIASLLSNLVEPEPAPFRSAKRKSTPLLRSIKFSLKKERILARRDEGLEAHRVVPHHQIAEGLWADLMLKNGAWHILQTVDATSDDIPLRRAIQSIGISALVFEQARMVYGAQETNAKLIYQASASIENALTPSLLAAEHQGAKLVNWESGDDQRSLLTNLVKLSEPIEEASVALARVHASTQAKFKLN